MNSLPTVDNANQEQFNQILSKFDPELYLIKISLVETGVNPALISPIIRSISNLAIGSGYGKVTIYMRERKINNIEGLEHSLIELSATED